MKKLILLVAIQLVLLAHSAIAQDAGNKAWFARASALGTFTDRSDIGKSFVGLDVSVGRQWSKINLEAYVPNFYVRPKQRGNSYFAFGEQLDFRYLPLGWNKTLSPYIMASVSFLRSRQVVDYSYYNPNDPNDPYLPSGYKTKQTSLELAPGIGTYINLSRAWAIDVSLPYVFGVILADYKHYHTIQDRAIPGGEKESKSSDLKAFNRPYKILIPFAQLGIVYRIIR